jgi:TRAP-type C4-dicarboxylate transport system substrate-binding protein
MSRRMPPPPPTACDQAGGEPPDLVEPSNSGRVSRRFVLAGALATPFIGKAFIGRAGAAEPARVLRVAHAAPSTFPLQLRLTEAAAQINLRSEGKVALQIHPNSELGSPVGMLGQVRAGTLDAAALSSQTLAEDLVSMNLPLIGFAFAGYDQLWPALDGELGAMLIRQMRARLDLVAVGRCWDFGFRQITTATRPIATAADMSGMLIRSPPEIPFVTLLQALQVRPVNYALDELSRALQTHSVEGQQGMIRLVLEAGLFQWQSHCALTNHIWDGQWLLFSRKVWDRIPADLQGIITTACDEAALAQRKDTATAEAVIRGKLEQAGMTFNAVEPDSFRAALTASGYYANWRSKLPEDGWALLEKFSGRLASH